MTQNILPLSTVINVNVTEEPTGIGLKNVNALGLFTNEIPNNSNTYGIYFSAAQVAADFGSNSVTAAMANNIFAQSPNILAGSGQLVIMPMIAAVSATSGHFNTVDLSTHVAAFQAVSNGNLKVTLNGTNVYNLGNLNFTNTATLADIAAVIDNAIPDCHVALSGNLMVFTNNKVGTAATVALASYSGGGTDLTGATLLNSAAGTATPGVNSSGETVGAAIARTSSVVSYTGLITNLNLEDAAIEAAAVVVQANDILFFVHTASTTDIAGIGTTVQQDSQTQTRVLEYTGTQAAANLMKAAYVGRFFCVDFTGSNTSITMNLKQLANVAPDGWMTSTLQVAAGIAGVNIYPSIDGYPCVISAGGNTYDDIIYRNLALQFALETAAFNYLAGTTTKIPQTEQGVNGLKNAIAQIMQQFVINGSLAPGAWPSPDTFGNQILFLSNIANFGYYIYSLPVAKQTPAARAARQAPLIQVAALGSGAIQYAAINVIVSF